MKKQEQLNFVNELCDNVKSEILKKINDDKIPENWDGIELRQYIADSFNGCIIKGTMSRSRKREYNNTILVDNL